MPSTITDTARGGILRPATGRGTDVIPVPRPRTRTPPAYLIQVHPVGPTLGRRFSIGPRPLILGRHATADIAVAGPGVADIHARVEYLPAGAHLVTDFGSPGGTFVNDVPVAAGVICDGEYLRIGDSLFRFLTGEDLENRYRAELLRLAGIDPLTGLPDGKTLDESLSRACARAARDGDPVSVAVLDLDWLRVTNDRFGRPAGDAALFAVADRLREAIGEGDTLTRYRSGGFATILPGMSEGAAVQVAERLRLAAGAAPVRLGDGREVRVAVSGGVAGALRGKPGNPADLLRQASDRLTAAKMAGRNRVRPEPVGASR
jgi:diguanylate cyclase (GGDEF)-like protein